MSELEENEKIIGRVKRVGAIILGHSENRSWIELCNDGDLMHTQRFELPGDPISQIFVEEIPHKSTIFEPPRTMIFLSAPCEIEIVREGNNFIVRERKEAPSA
jgi:hypothetical protein